MADKGHSVGQRVLLWARGKKGQQVGRGECWDLADQALRHAGARSSTTTGANDDYNWGDEVALKDVKPGDVLQFRDLVIQRTTETVIKPDDGARAITSRFQDRPERRGPIHTAIVDKVLTNGDLTIWEQHVLPLGKRVQIHTIHTRSRVLPQTVRHARMKDAAGVQRLVTIFEKVTIEVSGKVWAYRAKPR